MKTKVFMILAVAWMISFSPELRAQVFQVSFNDHLSAVLGDFSKNDMTNPNAGYVMIGSGTNLEFKYYKRNFGIGLRASLTSYMRDTESYQTDLKGDLGISGEDYYITMNGYYYAIGADLGVSYLLGISQKFQIEPYLYFSFRELLTPLEEVVYAENGTTFTYRKNPTPFYGVAFIPGVKFNWKLGTHVGLNAYLEYEGSSYVTDTEQSVLHSHNSLELTSTDRTFKPNSVNIGLGLSFSFGKGLRDQ